MQGYSSSYSGISDPEYHPPHFRVTVGRMHPEEAEDLQENLIMGNDIQFYPGQKIEKMIGVDTSFEHHLGDRGTFHMANTEDKWREYYNLEGEEDEEHPDRGEVLSFTAQTDQGSESSPRNHPNKVEISFKVDFDFPEDMIKVLDIRCKNHFNTLDEYRSIPRMIGEPIRKDADGN